MKKRKGILLLELIMITLVATITVGALWPVIGNRNDSRNTYDIWTRLEQISLAARQYMLVKGELPLSIDELRSNEFIGEIVPPYGEFGIQTSPSPLGVYVFCGEDGGNRETKFFDKEIAMELFVEYEEIVMTPAQDDPSGGDDPPVEDGHGRIEYNLPGTYSFTVPAGVTRIYATGTGGGGAGGRTVSGTGTARIGQDDTYYGYIYGGGGGGSGAVVIDKSITVTPGAVLAIVVGAGGTGKAGDGNDGEDTTIITGSTTLLGLGGGKGGKAGVRTSGAYGSVGAGGVKGSGGTSTAAQDGTSGTSWTRSGQSSPVTLPSTSSYHGSGGGNSFGSGGSTSTKGAGGNANTSTGKVGSAGKLVIDW